MKKHVQKFGRALSAMVMPNIGAFIAWGLITALFIPAGWYPNETLVKIGEPMMTCLLPILIAFTGGSNIYGHRGGITGAIATTGVIAGSNIPMFIGAMILGPVGAYCIKTFDKTLGKKVKAGFEMLVNNFSAGIIGMLLAIAGYLVIGNIVGYITELLKQGVSLLISSNILPLISIIVEPAKVLFLNNAINHGICTPLGIQDVHDYGQSIIFMIESNPGAGLGILLATWLFGQGTAKQSAPGAAIIHFFGGIHEIFFPYVLAQPLLLIATICGSASALLFYTFAHAGLVAPASPGSIIAFLAMAPKGQTLIACTGVLIACGVSFAIASLIVKFSHITQEEDTQEPEPVAGRIQKIIFACDAGMGSSALGATRFKSRLIKENITDVICTNSAIDQVPANASVIVCQKALAERTATLMPDTPLVIIDNFLSDAHLDALLAEIKQQANVSFRQPADVTQPSHIPSGPPLLQKANILLGLKTEDKDSAIRRAGKLLEETGYVLPGYAEAMIERERLTTTYMGMGLAIPHGTSEAKDKVMASGIVILQYPDGICFAEDEKAYLVIGIAGVGNEHLDILSKIASTLDDEELLNKLFTTTDSNDFYNILK